MPDQDLVLFTSQDTNLSYDLVKQAQEKGMVTEAVMWALQQMKLDPSLGINQALKLGVEEWCK